MKGEKKYTRYSDNPKMNTAEYPKRDKSSEIMVMGFSMGGMVPMGGGMSVKDRLIDRADRDRRNDEMLSERLDKIENGGKKKNPRF